MSKRIRIIFAAGILIALVGAVFFVRRQYVLPIIMYHSVKPAIDPGDRLSVTQDTFRRQMRFLKERRFRVVSLDQAAALIQSRRPVPARTLAITFDDGFEDNYRYAFAVLKEYGIPATIFVIVSRIDEPGYLTAAQIKEMHDSGLVTFGSHSLNHAFLPKVADTRALRTEIEDSRMRLTQLLGAPVASFAYPIGGFNAAVRQAVIDAGYTHAVATNPGKRFASSDVFALKRLRISENARNLFVFWFETSGYYNLVREHRHK